MKIKSSNFNYNFNSLAAIVAIAISSLFLASCQTLQSVDRGLYGVADKVSSRDKITGARKLNMADRSKQIAQGNKIIEETLAKYEQAGKPINEKLNAPQYNRLKNIFNQVFKVTHLRDENWKVYLVPENSFNAYVTGGTAVVVHLGLMQELAFDDEIAVVLAHEIAHVSANHVFEQQASLLASSLAKSKSGSSKAVSVAYTHNNEVEADQIGVLYAALAGYNPDSAVSIWERMYNKGGNRGSMISSHPISSERITLAKNVAAKVKQYYIPGQTNPNFEQILDSNSLYQKGGVNLAAGSGGGLAAVAETFLNYQGDKMRAQQEVARQSGRISSLKQIENAMSIVPGSGKQVGAQEFQIGIQYNGAYPVEKLSIRAVSESGDALYRVPGIVQPGQTFSAVYNSAILAPVNGVRPKMKLVVDEGYFVE